ncbi:MAG: bifunctional (p)ppGpp synthetase/guanosine-3',5'-bis(diphosphate) 3'-pyrophosphohydrolase, partial [Acidimicrobiia bacterium]|nr:bifunctional (p)ppGpp synthetase/guanosine-3',5'-bis(diphosphate) 3'-pyrophosphohydrolase [Acidimicrobiia bacterium]
EAQQAATMRKMLVAMAKDIRVLLIKLADRLHNMRTIAALRPDKQQRIAQETLDVYAPLAHRLGIAEMKWQLEDLAFATLYPKRYAEIEQMVSTRSPERDVYLAQVLEEVRERLAELRIRAEVTGRPKHYWSIYEKMVVKGREFNDIFDLVGIRVLVDSVKDCYAALGSIHATWKPVQGRFKDYIAMPKFNLYQSLHTTVVGPQGKPVEVQIRTREMHRRAEFGVAAHWGYKEHTPDSDTAWLQRIVDWQQETSDPREFMESLKIDLEQDEVFVFTPKGDVVTLPAKATPIDFAYAIHTEVGHRCIGARINGRLTSLDTALTSGDTVEVFTSKVAGAGPSRDWLKIVVTPRARNKIRPWFSRERREDAIENGRDELTKALRREGLPVQKVAASAVIPKVAEAMNYADLDALHAAIGEGHVSAKSVAQRIGRELRGGDHEEQLPSTARQPRPSRRKQTVGVHVEGLDDVMVRLSRCCTPVRGDEIIGFVTRGRGVSVHRADCANAASLVATNADRLIEVEWDRDGVGVFVASIEIEALDRSKLLRDISTVLSDHHVNILTSSSHTGSDRVAHLRFDFELGDPSHLESLLGTLKRVDSVFDAYRVLPGHGNGNSSSRN